MCSVDSTEDGTMLMQEKQNIDIIEAVCRKCVQKNAVVVLQTKFPYCRECFLSVVSHKFFGILGKSKMMRPGSRLMVAFSGSASSVAVLNLIHEGLNRRKKLASEVFVVYIDDGASLGLSDSERREFNSRIKFYLSKYSFITYFTSLTVNELDVVLVDIKNLESQSEVIVNNKQSDLLNNCKSATSREDFVSKIRKNLLVSVARKLGCDKIFTCETSNHLAVRILSNVALGRGSQIQNDVEFLSDREDVIILRPLSEWTRKEVAYYNLFNSLEPIIRMKLNQGGFSSIQSLTEEFVANLQDSFPSTVYTIVGTGSKLQVKNNSGRSCILCKAKVEAVFGEVNALNAAKISHMVSSLGCKGFNSVSLSPLEAGCTTECKDSQSCRSLQPEACNKKEMDEGLSKYLCHGCQILVNDSISLRVWAENIYLELKKELLLEKMNEEIKEFLLE